MALHFHPATNRQTIYPPQIYPYVERTMTSLKQLEAPFTAMSQQPLTGLQQKFVNKVLKSMDKFALCEATFTDSPTLFDYAGLLVSKDHIDQLLPLNEDGDRPLTLRDVCEAYIAAYLRDCPKQTAIRAYDSEQTDLEILPLIIALPSGGLVDLRQHIGKIARDCALGDDKSLPESPHAMSSLERLGDSGGSEHFRSQVQQRSGAIRVVERAYHTTHSLAGDPEKNIAALRLGDGREGPWVF